MEVRKAIDEGNEKLLKALRKGDATAAAKMYTEDASAMPAGSVVVKGRENIKEMWGSVIEGGLKDAKLTTVAVVGEGNTVTEMGEYWMKLHPEGHEAMEDKGKYVVVWKNTPDGWKLHWDIWNTNVPPT